MEKFAKEDVDAIITDGVESMRKVLQKEMGKRREFAFRVVFWRRIKWELRLQAR